MKINRFLRIKLLLILSLVLILSGVGLHMNTDNQKNLQIFIFIAAALMVLSALPFIHFSLMKPISRVQKEVSLFSKTWFDKEPGAKAMNLDSLSKDLKNMHDRIDKSTLRARELEATVNVYALEKEQMEAIFKSLPIAVLITNQFNELILANEVSCQLLNIDSESNLSKPVEDALDWKELVSLIKGTSNRKIKVPRRMVELYYQPEGTEQKVLRVILSSISDHRNQIVGVVTIIQDATKDREIDRMKSEFVANVSHELKTPLSSIKAYTEMLHDGEAKDEKTHQEFCTVIENESDRLSNMIDTLLDLSKLEAGVVQMEMERVNLIQMLKSVEDAMRPNAANKNITLTTDISQYIVPVLGDKGQLNRVFVNLVSNAVKYTMENGKVDITARLEGDLVRVDVADNGYGIPEEDLPKIFEKFFRVKENKKVAKGTGMGLAMVQRILDIHNAEIKVKSKTGEGSCFSVYIPAAN